MKNRKVNLNITAAEAVDREFVYDNERNFERPFTPRTWPAHPPNFAKMRFRQFRIFHFSAKKILFNENFGSKILFFAIFSRFWRS